MNQRHAERTPAGTSFHRGDPEMGDLPHRVSPDPDGRYTADVHVTPDGHARIGDRLYTPEEFADILRRGGDYDGRPVRLIGCDAGSNDFAHRLSRALDTEVLAPNKPAWTDSNGTIFSSDYEMGPDGRLRPKIPPNGGWDLHRPDGTASGGSADGFTPDTADAGKTGVDVDGARPRGRARQDEWLDRPQSDGQTLREKLRDKDWIDDNYYQRRSPKGHLELVVRPNKLNADEIPPLDLRRPDANDGPDIPRIRDEEKGIDYVAQPKSARPPVEPSDHDRSRVRVVEPERVDAHLSDRNGSPGSHDGEHDESSESVPDTDSAGETEGYADASDWREEDYRAIDELISDREQKLNRLRNTEEETDSWTAAHNAKNDASEALGEKAAEHAIRDQVHSDLRAHYGNDVTLRAHPGHPPESQRLQAVDGQGNVLGEIEPMHPTSGAKPGPGTFDQIWKVDYRDGGDAHYIIHEAKGPGATTGSRYLPDEARTVEQGHPDYFGDIAGRMGDRNLAAELLNAKSDGRLDYVEIRPVVDESTTPHRYVGYEYSPYDGYGYRKPFGGAETSGAERGER